MKVPLYFMFYLNIEWITSIYYFQLHQMQEFRLFRLKVTLNSLKLSLKFNCKVSLTLKYKSKEYPIVEDQSLVSGQLVAPTVQVNDLPYKQKENVFGDKQEIVLIFYLHTTYGKLQICSFVQKLKEINGSKRIKQGIKNSPDKQAQIELTIQLQPTIKQKTNSIQAQQSLRLNKTIIQSGISSNSQLQVDLKNKFIKNPKATLALSKSAVQYKIPSPKDLQQRESNSGYNQGSIFSQDLPRLINTPSEYNLTNITKKRQPIFKSRSQDRIEALKRRLSLQKSASNQKLSQQKQSIYTQKLIRVQYQNEENNQPINSLRLQMKSKENLIKFLQKELMNKSKKLQTLQKQMKGTNRDLQIKQQKIKQLQHSIEKMTEELEQCRSQKLSIQSKSQKKQEQHKLQLKQYISKYNQIEKEKQKLLLKIQSFHNKIEERQKQYQQQIKQVQRRMNELKNTLKKQIQAMNKKYQQVKEQKNNIEADSHIIKKELLQHQRNSQRLYYQTLRLKDRQEELTQQIKSLQITRNRLNDQLQQQKKVSTQVLKLKQNLQQKEQQIAHLQKYTETIEEQLRQLQQKLRQTQLHLQKIQKQYEDLYLKKVAETQELENKNKTIEELIQSLEDLEKKIQTLKLFINSQQTQKNQNNSQMSQKIKDLYKNYQKLQYDLKQAVEEAKEQKKQNKQLQLQNGDIKKHNEQLNITIQKLENQKEILNDKIVEIKAANDIVCKKNQDLQKTIELLNYRIGQKEKLLKANSQEIEIQLYLIEKQNQVFKNNCQKMQIQVQELTSLVEEGNHLLESKEKIMGELTQQLRVNNSQIKMTKQTNLSVQKESRQLKTYIDELKSKFESVTQQLRIYHLHLNEIHKLLQLQQAKVEQKSYQEQILKQKDRLLQILVDLQCKEKNIQDKQLEIQQLKLKAERREEEFKKLNKSLLQAEKQIQEMHQFMKKHQTYLPDTMVTRQNIKLLKKQIVILQLSLDESNKKIDNLEQTLEEKIQLIQKLQLSKQKHSAQVKQFELNYSELMKQLFQKLDIQKGEIVEKNKQIADLEKDKNNRIQMMNKTIEELKRQGKDMQHILQVEKSNSHKLGLFFQEMASALNKIQKAHNIKNLTMMPIKDLMGKIQAKIKHSSKLHTQYQKRTTYQDEKTQISENIGQVSPRANLKRVSSKNK